MLNHLILLNDFKVLSGHDREDIKLADAIYIHETSSTLKVQDGSVHLNTLFECVCLGFIKFLEVVKFCVGSF